MRRVAAALLQRTIPIPLHEPVGWDHASVNKREHICGIDSAGKSHGTASKHASLSVRYVQTLPHSSNLFATYGRGPVSRLRPFRANLSLTNSRRSSSGKQHQRAAGWAGLMPTGLSNGSPQKCGRAGEEEFAKHWYVFRPRRDVAAGGGLAESLGRISGYNLLLRTLVQTSERG